MTPDDFRRVALSMAEASEGAHQGHADFRVGGKIFASLGYPDESYGVLMLSVDEQKSFEQAYPSAFTPAKGAWGRRGNTQVRLETVKGVALRSAMRSAWDNRAPKRLREPELER